MVLTQMFTQLQGLMAPVQTQSQFPPPPSGGHLGREAQETPGSRSIPYKSTSVLGLKGQALLCCFFQSLGKILRSMYVPGTRGVASTLDHPELSVQKERQAINKQTSKNRLFQKETNARKRTLE